MRRRKNSISLAPTDLSNFLSCRHLSSLDLHVAKTGEERPARYGPVIDELKARGIAHEQAYLEHLKSEGLIVIDGEDWAVDVTGTERTMAAMGEGPDIIYQPILADEQWFGRADFLRRTETPSEEFPWSYEVIDTKLARDTRAGTLLQLCVYSWLLGKLQGLKPRAMYVVTPAAGFEPESYRLSDYDAYFRMLEQGMDRFIAKPPETYPDLVSYCDYCVWWSRCEAVRRQDDHLCYVAGISGTQIKWLRESGIERLGQLADVKEPPNLVRGSKDAVVRLVEQARAQAKTRDQGRPHYELKKPFDSNHGLALLPEPTPDDIFLDFEGNHFSEGVSEYLTGYVAPDHRGELRYSALWAKTRSEEKANFEAFIDTTMAVLAKNPGAHIYHFAPYEPTAMKRLMGRYATREIQLDELLRGGVFVDLHHIVKRSLVAGVERYSIKDLEPFFGYGREQDLRAASMSRRLVEYAIEAGDLDERFADHQCIVEDYNREDCESAKRLRDWLEEIRHSLQDNGTTLPRPQPLSGEASEEIGSLDRRLRRLRDGLLDGVPTEPDERTSEQQAKFLLAHMMEFHRREDKASWWEYFRVLDLDTDDYEDERRAITGLTFVETIEHGRTPIDRYRFPAQELDARRKDEVRDTDGNRYGKVEAINYSERTIDIKKRRDTVDLHLDSVLLHNQVLADALRQSLMRIGQSVLDLGFQRQPPYAALLELLLKNPIAEGEDDLQAAGETTVEAACRLVKSLDRQVLAIQGPPGTGKTYTGAHMICALKEVGLRVGVTAVSHKVIANLLEGAKKEAARRGLLQLNAWHRRDGDYEGDWDLVHETSYPKILEGLSRGYIDVVGGTPWQWARPEFAESVDVLIVDEAGQMSLANVLAAGPGGKNLVLLGDPQQLEQPLQSSHPEGSEVSALHHLLDGEETMPPHRGLFLAETWRLHPDIARFTSEVYYEGKVTARPELRHQAVLPQTSREPPGTTPDMFEAPRMSPVRGTRQGWAFGSGLRYVPVPHRGNQARSDEEVAVIVQIVEDLLVGILWRDKDEKSHPVTRDDVLIIAPYNAQVAALSEALPMLSRRIGTVDRFQGQEAPIVIYSMTSSSPEDAPRGMEFLYNPNRFNVATSRARALCLAVGSPALFEPQCRTPRQMKMANGFCRYLELAELSS